MRTGVLALSAADGATLVAWKKDDQLGWQLGQGPAPAGAAAQDQGAAQPHVLLEGLDLRLAQGGGVEVVDDDCAQPGELDGAAGEVRGREVDHAQGAGGRQLHILDLALRLQ